MFKYILIFIFFVLISNSKAEIKEKIIENLQNVENLKFIFEQNINGKIENGICIIEYPKKIYCKYIKNNKILVSNGKSLVIKTKTSFYRYSLKKTPLNLILDKKLCIFIMKQVLTMIYLSSVDSYYDQQTGLVYVCKSKSCRDTNEGIILKEMKEQWWESLTSSDLSRIHSNGGLY